MIKMSQRDKAIFSLVFRLHKSDGQLHDKEYKYLFDLSKFLGLSETEVNEIIAEPSAYELIPPPKEQDRMEILYFMLFAMQIDGHVEKNEEQFIYETGLKMGFQEHMIKDMIDVLKEHLSTRVPDGVLIEIIKKYMN